MVPLSRSVALICCLLAAAASYGQDQRGLDKRNAERVAAVFDANGTYVGNAEAFDANFGVEMAINGAVVYVGIQRLSDDNFSNASASRFRWKAIDCTTAANCSNPLLVSCGGGFVSDQAVHGDQTRFRRDSLHCNPVEFDRRQRL
ncbi:hypothetical protein H3V53_42335 [Paraburkholderia bengalensis]|uniref:Uncharacterized protein n=1 Tax=Paraburkholderia bengalensis TaxID=2747562 RepID=A0ABU8J713_9BURK